MDAANVTVLPPPVLTRPGDGPLVIEVAPAYGDGAGEQEPATQARGPIAAAASAETSPAVGIIEAPPVAVELAIVRESRQADGRTLQLVRTPGALIEILRDAQGSLLSARDARE